MYPRGEGPGSVDRGQEATGGPVESEASILPGRALTQTREPLHVAPEGPGVRLVLLRQRVRLGGLLLRQIESLHSRVEHRVPRSSEFLGSGPQEQGAVVRSVCVDLARNRKRRAHAY